MRLLPQEGRALLYLLFLFCSPSPSLLVVTNAKTRGKMDGMTTTRAAVAGCSSSVAGRGPGRGAAVAAIAENRGIKPARAPRVHALSRPHLHSVDARQSLCFLHATKWGFKRTASAPVRATNGDGNGDDSTVMPSTSSSSEPLSETSQQQQDLDLLRRAQARDTGTTYPLEETKVSKRANIRVEIEWLDQSNVSL